MSQPLLSIGMIVKNEERCLEKCLKALEPLRQAIPCELVIADTGSIDRTKEIASKYADILFDFKWVNDFSKARNAVMDKCSGKWYLTVDADEYLASSPEEIVSFLNTSLASEKIFATTVIRNYTTPSMKGNYRDFHANRMTRMNTGNRYNGVIHEAFKVIDVDTIYPLKNTIFDHDGYTKVSPTHFQEKEKRNLELLEAQLSQEPENLRCILHCLESSSSNLEKQKYYTDYAFKQLQKTEHKNTAYNKLFAPTCASIALGYAVTNKHINTEKYFEWTLKTFKESSHVLIDVNYNYAKYLQSEMKYEHAIVHYNTYLLELKNYEKRNIDASTDLFSTPLRYTFNEFQNEVKSHLTNLLVELERYNEIEQYLSSINLIENTSSGLHSFLNAISNPKFPEQFLTIAIKLINNFFEAYHLKGEISEETYSIALTVLSEIFSSVKNEKNPINFSLINGTIGISAKITNTETKPKVEILLNLIENWEEFMPLALKQTLLLKCNLPKEFYTMSSQRLGFLINDITNVTDEIADVVTNHYCKEENLKTFPQISFMFNLLSSSLFSNNIALSNEIKLSLINNFIFVAEHYITECYNKKLLENPEYVNCLPDLHLFSWYLVNAFKEKKENPLGYIKTLKEIINKVPQAKQIVEFLIEEFKNEEELKRQEKIKATSPELIQMAEQLKTMLKVFPPNSPELLAIKQSPMYKQVAFLIED